MNMKKIIILISILVLSASMVFAQQWSVRKDGTAGLFGSDSDDVSASDIYGLDKAFLSLGSNIGDQQTIAFGVLAPTMYLGVIANIGDFDFTKNSEDDGTTKTDRWTDDSTFNITAAFGLSDAMGLHYYISRDGSNTKTEKTDADNDTTSTETKKASWIHELAFAIELGNGMKFNVPVGMNINQDEHKPYSPIESGRSTYKSVTSLYLRPDFTMPLDLGVFSQIKFGGVIQFVIKTDYGKTWYFDTTTTNGVSTKPNEDYIDTRWGLNVTPTFEFNLADNQLNFIVEPTVIFTMVIKSDGKPAGSTSVQTTNTIKPSISIPFGAVYSPVEWFELRAGLNYNVAWYMHNTVTDTEGQDENKKSWYSNSSSLGAYFGLGFTVAENFFLDIAFAPLLQSGTPIPAISFDKVTLQVSYRF